MGEKKDASGKEVLGLLSCLGIFGLVIIIGFAMGGSDDPPAPPPSTPSAAASPADAADPLTASTTLASEPGPVGPTSRCEIPSPELVALIGERVDAGAFLRGTGMAVRSTEHVKVWMVAVEIDGAGIEGDGDVGVWAVNDITGDTEGGLLILSVDGMAKEFTDWVHGSDHEAGITLASDGVDEAIECLYP